jgi:tetratricopeptide (TPR) repeat protein
VWIAHQVESAGRPTTLLRWEPPDGRPLGEALGTLLAAPGRVLLVLDDWYVPPGPHAGDIWREALAALPPRQRERFAAVGVAARPLPASALPLRPVDLCDLDEPEARRRILRRLDIDPDAAAPADGHTTPPRFPYDPPAVWNAPHRSARFTGREAVLAEVHRRLENGGRAGVRLALRGMSGVGKSQIATEYVHRFADHYDVVWWINAGYRATAREQFAALAPHLGLPTGKEIGYRIRAVHDALRVGRPHRRWLIVFDSADDMEQIEDLLPQGTGNVLITSLTRDWAISGDAAEIEVEAFSRAESIAYARRRAARLTESEADALAEAVQDLPLLLSQTAAELAASSMPAHEYVDLIRRGDANRIGIRISPDYPMGFATMWSITLNTLQDKNPEAVELLHLFSLFAPDAIPVRLMQSARPASLPEHLSALAADPIRWYTALRRLSEASTVRMDYAEGADTEPYVDHVTMHRVYHRFLRSTLTEERRAALSAAACRVLADADPRRPTDTRSWSHYAELIPHLEPTGALDSGDPEVRQLILNCVNYLRVRGENRTGLRLCEQVLDRWRPRMAFDQRELRVLVHQHTHMLRRLGRYREALEIGRETVARLAAVRDPDHSDLLLARDGLGATLVALGRYQEAYQLFDASVRAFAASLGEESPRTLQDRGNLALVLGLLGRYQEAADLDHATLTMRERVLKPRHPLTLETATRYARWLRLLGRYPQATSRAELNVRVLRQVMDRHTPQTLLAEHNLAMCLRRAGDHSASLALMGSVVDRFLRHSGPMTPDTLVVQTDYATILRQHGDFDRARESSATVAGRWRELLGAGHPFAIGTAGNVGLVLWSFGERDEALAIAERARRDMAAAVGPDHPWTVGCVLNASGAAHFAGDHDGALALSRTAVAGARAALGEHHPLTLSCQAALAGDLRATRDERRADELEAEVVGRLADTLGDRHPHTLAMRRRKRPYWEFEPHPT